MSALPDARPALVECEAVIERGLATFVEVGQALLRIRDERLYRDDYGTFEDYCRERWQMGRTFAFDTIESSKAMFAIANARPDLPPPANESVVRELRKVDPLEGPDTWAAVVDLHGDKPTAAQVREVVDQRKPDRMAVHYSSATDEWATPQDLFDTLHAEFDFTLDVCALDSSAKCQHYFTPETDGLAQDWTGTCWMNPPYGDVIGQWVKKAHDSALEGATVVCLVPARVDTGWWWDFCRHGEIRFLRGRLKFGGSPNSAPFPSAVVVFGVEPRVVWWER